MSAKRRRTLGAIGLAWLLVCAPAVWAQSKISSETLLQTTKAWDGTPYVSYGTGQPQITVLRISIPPHSALPWHRHPVINVGYVLNGKLFVEKQGDGLRRELQAGEALPEMVGGLHRGYTEDEPATLLAFYAGIEGTPLTVVDDGAVSAGH